MRIPRIYHPAPLSEQHHVQLSDDAVNHIGRVLRMSLGDKLELFDGSNNVFSAVITEITKRTIEVTLGHGELNDRESPLHLHLGQVISRGEKMEFTIQKSIELGVNEITPLISERCGVKLDDQRMEKKRQQWQKIIISACEQCGRNTIPLLHPAQTVESWCAQDDNSLKLNLHPRASKRIGELPDDISRIRLLIGPEGGLSDQEITMTTRYEFTDILLGPRILRTETAALTTIAALQTRFGDLG